VAVESIARSGPGHKRRRNKQNLRAQQEDWMPKEWNSRSGVSTQRRGGHCIHHEQPLAIRRAPPSTCCGHTFQTWQRGKWRKGAGRQRGVGSGEACAGFGSVGCMYHSTVRSRQSFHVKKCKGQGVQLETRVDATAEGARQYSGRPQRRGGCGGGRRSGREDRRGLEGLLPLRLSRRRVVPVRVPTPVLVLAPVACLGH